MALIVLKWLWKLLKAFGARCWVNLELLLCGLAMRNFSGLDLHACMFALERRWLVNFARNYLWLTVKIVQFMEISPFDLCKIFWLLMMKAFASPANFRCEFYLIWVLTKIVFVPLSHQLLKIWMICWPFYSFSKWNFNLAMKSKTLDRLICKNHWKLELWIVIGWYSLTIFFELHRMRATN